MKPARAILASVLIPAALLSTSCSREAAGSSRPSSGNVDTAAIQAVVSFVSGDVTAGSGTQKTTVRIGDTLAKGQTLATGARSECTLQLGDRATIRIAENTQLLLDEVVLDPGRSSIGLRAIARGRSLQGRKTLRRRTLPRRDADRGRRRAGHRVQRGGVGRGGHRARGAAGKRGHPAGIDRPRSTRRWAEDGRSGGVGGVRGAPERRADRAGCGEGPGDRDCVQEGGRKPSQGGEGDSSDFRQETADRSGEESIPGRHEESGGRNQREHGASHFKAGTCAQACAHRPTPVPPPYDATNPIPIEILNNSFDMPETSGEKVATDDWVCGGTWYGRWAAPVWAQDGSGFVWASFRAGGPGNGYSQELVVRYVIGHYDPERLDQRRCPRARVACHSRLRFGEQSV